MIATAGNEALRLPIDDNVRCSRLNDVETLVPLEVGTTFRSVMLMEGTC